jgi:hypothetical protein
LRFKAGKDGDYTVLVAKVRLMMFYFWKIKTKTITDLNVNPTCQFKGSIKDATDRFELRL